MNYIAPMAGALAGIMRVMNHRIEKAILLKETWTYQFGNSPAYRGNNVIMDTLDYDNDLIKLSFLPSATEGYNLTIVVGFDAAEGEDMGGLMIDINTESGECATSHPCDCEHPPFTEIMDLGSVVNAMAMFDLCDKLEAEQAARVAVMQAAQADRTERRGRLTLVR